MPVECSWILWPARWPEFLSGGEQRFDRSVAKNHQRGHRLEALWNRLVPPASADPTDDFNAAAAGLEAVCPFSTATDERADVIVSIDAFEHFDDPPSILRIMDGLLGPEAEVLASFGPTWYHSFGGHLFSVFPWAHLLFSERALMRWRSDIRNDGAARFGEVAGGLN